MARLFITSAEMKCLARAIMPRRRLVRCRRCDIIIARTASHFNKSPEEQHDDDATAYFSPSKII